MLMLDMHRDGSPPVPVEGVHIPNDRELDIHTGSYNGKGTAPLATWETSSGPQVLRSAGAIQMTNDTSGNRLASYRYAPVSPQRGSWMSGRETSPHARQERRDSPVEPRRSFTPNITKMASDIRREGPMHEQMQRKGEEYKAHIHAMRRERDNLEIAQMRSGPEINKPSKHTAQDRGVSQQSVETRLLEKLKTYQSHVDAERIKQHEVEMVGVTHSPSLSKKTIELTSHRQTMTAMQYWDTKKKEKVKIMKLQKEATEMSEVKATPHVNARSRSLCANDSLRKETPSVVERLMRQGEETKRRQLDKRVSELERQQHQAHPGLYTNSLHASFRDVTDIQEEPGTVFDRLHMESRDIAVRKLERSVQGMDTSFSPRINKKSIQLSGGDITGSEPVHERLIRCGEEAKQRKAEEVRRLGTFVAQQSDVSHYLGAYTTLLGELNRSGSPRPQSPGPFHTALRATQNSPSRNGFQQGIGSPKFSPYIGQNSRRMDEAANGVSASPMSRIERLLATGKERNSKIERAKAESLAKEKELIDTLQKSGKKSGVQSNTPTRDMYQWNMEWKNRVRNATNRTRAQIAEDEENKMKTSCSFSPRLNPSRKPSAKSGGATGSSADTSAANLDPPVFATRLQDASFESTTD